MNNIVPLESSVFLNLNTSIKFEDNIDLNDNEKHLLSIIFNTIIQEQKDYKFFECDLNELSYELNIPKDNLESELNIMCSKLLKKVVKIESKDNKQNDWKMFHCIGYTELKNEKLVIELSDDMIPYIRVFNENLIPIKD